MGFKIERTLTEAEQAGIEAIHEHCTAIGTSTVTFEEFVLSHVDNAIANLVRAADDAEAKEASKHPGSPKNYTALKASSARHRERKEREARERAEAVKPQSEPAAEAAAAGTKKNRGQVSKRIPAADKGTSNT